MPASRTGSIVGVLLLLWNLMGVAALFMQYGLDPAEIAKTDPAAARAFAAMPAWLWAVYALAVGAGTLGAISLLMKKALAATLFLASLVAVLVQFGYTLGATDLIAEKGLLAATGFPTLVILIAVFQLFYSRSLVAKGMLR